MWWFLPTQTLSSDRHAAVEAHSLKLLLVPLAEARIFWPAVEANVLKLPSYQPIELR